MKRTTVHEAFPRQHEAFPLREIWRTNDPGRGDPLRSPENKRAVSTLRLRINEQYAPISVCYMPTDGAFVNATYKQTVGMLSPIARTPRLHANEKPQIQL